MISDPTYAMLADLIHDWRVNPCGTREELQYLMFLVEGLLRLQATALVVPCSN